MAEIQIPQALLDYAKSQGIKLDSTIKYDAESALHAVSAYFNGETSASFGGFSLRLPRIKAGVKAVAQAAAKPSLKLPSRKPAVAFVVPKKMTPLQALGAADRLLGSTSIMNKPQVIQATQALAALGDPNAIRGLATLTTAAQVRVQKKVPVGKPAIQGAPPVRTSKVAKKYTKSTVFNMAQAKLNANARANANLTIVQRIKRFFGFKI